MVTIKNLKENSPWFFLKFKSGKGVRYSIRKSNNGDNYLLVFDPSRSRKGEFLFTEKYTLIIIKKNKISRLLGKGAIDNSIKKINLYLKKN